MKSTLKAPGCKHLKLQYYKPLSFLLQFCFQIQHTPLHEGDHIAHRADPQGGRRQRGGPAVSARFKPSFRVTGHAEGRRVIGRVRDILRFDWLDFHARFEPILNGNVYGP